MSLDVETGKVLLSGSFAGACSTLAGAPFDTIKTRSQVDSSKFGGFLQSFSRSVREENPLALYKGSLPALTSAVVENTVVFAANSYLTREVKRVSGSRELSTLQQAAIGGLSGVFSAAAICPFEVIKVRLQAQSSERGFASASDCLRQALREGGVRSLFRGLPAQIARDVPFNFVFFGAYEGACKTLMWAGARRSKDELSGPEIVLAGGVAGIAGWAVSLPMDVIKSQVNMRSDVSVSEAVARTYRTRGVPGFFVGFTAVALRAFPCNGALFLSYEVCQKALRDL